MTVGDLIDLLKEQDKQVDLIFAGSYGSTSDDAEVYVNDEGVVVVSTGLCSG